MDRIFRIAVVGRRCRIAAFAIGAARQHGPTMNPDVWLGTRGARPSDFCLFRSRIFWPQKSTKSTRREGGVNAARPGQFNGRSRGDEALTFPGLGLRLLTSSPTKFGCGTVGCGGLAQGSGWLASFAQGLATVFQGRPAWSRVIPAPAKW